MPEVRTVTEAPLTPDFLEHAWVPLVSAEVHDGFVHVTWSDGIAFAAYSMWLAENVDGYGLDRIVRESTLEPIDLPEPDALTGASLDDDGALLVHWRDRPTTRVHPGWLRHIADERHLPSSPLPPVVQWSSQDLVEPPTIDGSNVLDDHGVLADWLAVLVSHGLARLANVPTDADFLLRLFERIGPVRDTNFGPIWSVQADIEPTSTANTGLDLGQHTDLPTRETPPGFQFLHCVDNTVEGGWSRMTDGLAVVEALRSEHPAAYEALTSLDWVFMNRSPVAEHRWIGPIIDFGSRHQPLTLRAFYPVRTAAHMDPSDIPRAYESLRVFAHVARDPRFQVRFPFRPGDLVGFDNRRVLHGRDAFDGGGTRHLRGCYADHDDVYSRLRVLLRRPAPPASVEI